MNKNKILKINGTTLDQEQLKNHLEKIATNHNLVNKSQKNTYPIPYLEENFKIIEEVYNILKECTIKASNKANKTLEEVKEAMKLNYFSDNEYLNELLQNK